MQIILLQELLSPNLAEQIMGSKARRERFLIRGLIRILILQKDPPHKEGRGASNGPTLLRVALYLDGFKVKVFLCKQKTVYKWNETFFNKINLKLHIIHCTPYFQAKLPNKHPIYVVIDGNCLVSEGQAHLIHGETHRNP